MWKGNGIIKFSKPLTCIIKQMRVINIGYLGRYLWKNLGTSVLYDSQFNCVEPMYSKTYQVTVNINCVEQIILE